MGGRKEGRKAKEGRSMKEGRKEGRQEGQRSKVNEGRKEGRKMSAEAIGGGVAVDSNNSQGITLVHFLPSCLKLTISPYLPSVISLSSFLSSRRGWCKMDGER